jgi:hypothetical protein
MKWASIRVRKREYLIVALVEEEPKHRTHELIIVENHNASFHSQPPSSDFGAKFSPRFSDDGCDMDHRAL